MTGTSRLGLGVALRLLVAVALGFTAALVVPRQRWRDRPLELPAGPWPPLDPPDGDGVTAQG